MTTVAQATTANRFMPRVYAWMTFGMGITALISFLVVTTPAISHAVFSNTILFYGLIIGELALVIAFTTLANRVSSPVAALMFTGYAALNGVTLSLVFLIYTAGSLAGTFAITAGMFAGMSIYGMVTKRDLTNVGSFAMMGLWGIIIASVVNIFLRSDSISWLASFCGVIVFTLLTAYDTQKMKALGLTYNDDSETAKKMALRMALMLYLNFINLFLSLLRLFGQRR